MKLLIDDDYTTVVTVDEKELNEYPDVAEQYANYLKSIYERYTVWHKINTTRDSITIRIKQQKICLDEVSMNHLIVDGFYDFDCQFTYAQLGGEGCETAFHLVLSDR